MEKSEIFRYYAWYLINILTIPISDCQLSSFLENKCESFGKCYCGGSDTALRAPQPGENISCDRYTAWEKHQLCSSHSREKTSAVFVTQPEENISCVRPTAGRKRQLCSSHSRGKTTAVFVRRFKIRWSQRDDYFF